MGKPTFDELRSAHLTVLWLEQELLVLIERKGWLKDYQWKEVKVVDVRTGRIYFDVNVDDSELTEKTWFSFSTKYNFDSLKPDEAELTCDSYQAPHWTEAEDVPEWAHDTDEYQEMLD